MEEGLKSGGRTGLSETLQPARSLRTRRCHSATAAIPATRNTPATTSRERTQAQYDDVAREAEREGGGGRGGGRASAAKRTWNGGHLRGGKAPCVSNQCARAAPAIVSGARRATAWLVSKANTWETCKRGIDRHARRTRLGRLDTTTRHQTPPAPAPKPPQTGLAACQVCGSKSCTPCDAIEEGPSCPF